MPTTTSASTVTEDGNAFTDANLAQYDAVIFLSTTGDVLDTVQQGAFERYIEAGGGYAGIHSASDTEYDWPWYGQLVGAYFNNHPNGTADRDRQGRGPLAPLDRRPAGPLDPDRRVVQLPHQPADPDPKVHVLASMDETSYTPGTGSMGAEHPIAWCQDYDGGRSWYTGMGHTEASFTDPLFLGHILGGIKTAAGVEGADCKATLEPSFQKVALDENTTNPMELAIAKDGRVFYIDRAGAVKIILANGTVVTAGTVPVYTGQEFGLLGIALDPNFDTNGWVYLYFAPVRARRRSTGSRASRSPATRCRCPRRSRSSTSRCSATSAATRVGRWSSTTRATSTSPPVTTPTRSTRVASTRSTSGPAAAPGTPSAPRPTPTTSTARC